MVTVLCAAVNEKDGAKTSHLILYKINFSLKSVLFFARNLSLLVKQQLCLSIFM